MRKDMKKLLSLPPNLEFVERGVWSEERGVRSEER